MMRTLLFRIARLGLQIDRRLDTQAGSESPPAGGVAGPATPARPGVRRGMALIVVLATLAILSTSIVEFVYNTRVNLYLAQNQRDEVKAYFLARSGINLQRLSLAYQFELDARGDMMASMMSRSNFQMWRYLPTLAPIFTTGSLSAGEIGSLDLTTTAATGFGGLHGIVDIHPIEPEEGKINLNEFASRNISQETLIRMCSLVFPDDFDTLMGVDGRRTIQDRFEVVAAIIDHIDPDSDQSKLTENCVLEQAGAGNEISRYRGLKWDPKNEPLVSVGEIRLVPGVSDAFMRQFESHFTVYPVTGQFYPNQANFVDWYGFLCSHIEGAQFEGFSMCSLPEVGQQASFLALVLDGYVRFFDDPLRVLMYIMGGMGGTTAPDMLSGGRMIPFASNGTFTGTINTVINSDAQTQLFWLNFADPRYIELYGFNSILGSGSLVPPRMIAQFDTAAMRRSVETGNPRIYTISTTGEYGAAKRTIRAVVDLRNYPDERILYWREY